MGGLNKLQNSNGPLTCAKRVYALSFRPCERKAREGWEVRLSPARTSCGRRQIVRRCTEMVTEVDVLTWPALDAPATWGGTLCAKVKVKGAFASDSTEATPGLSSRERQGWGRSPTAEALRAFSLPLFLQYVSSNQHCWSLT